VVDERQLLATRCVSATSAFEQVVPAIRRPHARNPRADFEQRARRADAVREAFTSAFRALDRFMAESLLSTGLIEIVVNAALDAWRSKRRRGAQPLDQLPPPLRPGRAEWIAIR